MTELLEKAFAEAANLPEAEQDELARNLLEDLAAEGKLDKKHPQFGSALPSESRGQEDSYLIEAETRVSLFLCRLELD
jgi:hypothetical protein